MDVSDRHIKFNDDESEMSIIRYLGEKIDKSNIVNQVAWVCIDD
jgi:hypothetical protein